MSKVEYAYQDFYLCNCCETDDGRPTLVWKGDDCFALCLECLDKLFLQYVAPRLKAVEHIKLRPKSISETRRNAIFKRDGYKCVSCGSKQDLTIDHIYPFSRGGVTTAKNLRTLCFQCNIKKGAR